MTLLVDRTLLLYVLRDLPIRSNSLQHFCLFKVRLGSRNHRREPGCPSSYCHRRWEQCYLRGIDLFLLGSFLLYLLPSAMDVCSEKKHYDFLLPNAHMFTKYHSFLFMYAILALILLNSNKLCYANSKTLSEGQFGVSSIVIWFIQLPLRI